MTQREKLLAVAVGSLLSLFIVYYGYGRYASAVRQRSDTLQKVRSNLDTLEIQVAKGAQAARQIKRLQLRSLPADRDYARTAYQQWLLDLVDRVGLENPSVRSPISRPIRDQSYERLKFEIDADATLPQVVDFLQNFYAAGDLHRIVQFTLNPIKGTRKLNLLLSVEGIIVPGTTRMSVADIPSYRRSHDNDSIPSSEALAQQIVLRNLFAPPNHPPRLEAPATRRIVRGRREEIQLQANDPDKLDSLSFAIQGEAPQGIDIDPAKGVLRILADKTGTVPVTVLVRDDGLPAQQATATIQLQIVDPPPPTREVDRRPGPPKFDEAQFTFLVATVETPGGPEAWFNIRTQGQTLKLQQGDHLQVGSVDAILQSIGNGEATLATDNGLLQLRIGENLGRAQPVDVANRPTVK